MSVKAHIVEMNRVNIDDVPALIMLHLLQRLRAARRF